MACLTCAAWINLFWYDAVCVCAKPENAFAWMAPVAKSFDNRVLGCWVLGAGILCAIIVLTRKRWLWGGLIVGAIAIQQAGYPESLGYTMRFKQLGQSSRVFEFLKQQSFSRHDTVTIHSADESSFFLACVNDYLLPRTGTMKYVDTLGEIEGLSVGSQKSALEPLHHSNLSPRFRPHWLIICAKDQFRLLDPVEGRRYEISWSFMGDRSTIKGYTEKFRDKLYLIYEQNGG